MHDRSPRLPVPEPDASPSFLPAELLLAASVSKASRPGKQHRTPRGPRLPARKSHRGSGSFNHFFFPLGCKFSHRFCDMQRGRQVGARVQVASDPRASGCDGSKRSLPGPRGTVKGAVGRTRETGRASPAAGRSLGRSGQNLGRRRHCGRAGADRPREAAEDAGCRREGGASPCRPAHRLVRTSTPGSEPRNSRRKQRVFGQSHSTGKPGRDQPPSTAVGTSRLRPQSPAGGRSPQRAGLSRVPARGAAGPTTGR